jgi:hypothetical protein
VRTMPVAYLPYDRYAMKLRGEAVESALTVR